MPQLSAAQRLAKQQQELLLKMISDLKTRVNGIFAHLDQGQQHEWTAIFWLLRYLKRCLEETTAKEKSKFAVIISVHVSKQAALFGQASAWWQYMQPARNLLALVQQLSRARFTLNQARGWYQVRQGLRQLRVAKRGFFEAFRVLVEKVDDDFLG